MYNLVFWFFYRYFEKYKGYKSPFLSAAAVVTALIIHLGLIHSIIRYFTGFNIGTFSTDYTTNKFILLPIVFLAFFICFKLYYQSRTRVILEKYENKNPFSLTNILLILIIMVVPIIAIAVLTNMAVRKFQ